MGGHGGAGCDSLTHGPPPLSNCPYFDYCSDGQLRARGFLMAKSHLALVSPTTGIKPIVEKMGASVTGCAKTEIRRACLSPNWQKKADISAMAIYNIENGKIKNPLSSTRNKLAAALDQPIPNDVVEATEQEQNIEGLGSLTDFNPYEEKEWPQCAGIYVLYDNTERPVYVGKGKKISTRLKVTYASYIEVKNEKTRHQLEQVLIKFLKSNAVLNKQSVEGFEEE
jgi:transcriptional regulator with XRE-family HTH domain